jgi:DNA polymerase-3 subunit beta
VEKSTGGEDVFMTTNYFYEEYFSFIITTSMKFSCGTADFVSSLQLVSRAIGSQQALPILGNILMTVEGKRCTVSATDLELSIITSFEAKIENEGAITIPAKAILNFAQYNNDPEVLLETNEGTNLRCTSRHAKAVIAGEAAAEFPTISSVEKQASIQLKSEPLLEALNLVTFAASRSTLRPVLSGVFVRVESGKLILVATDSYRLSEFILPISGGTDDISCIIPTKILEELRVILASQRDRKSGKEDKKKEEKIDETKGKTSSVDVVLSRQQIELTVGHTRLVSRLIDGKFPDYRQIIPKTFSVKAAFPSNELTTAVRRMHYFAKEINNNLTFSVTKGTTHIITPQTQMGRDEATIGTEGSGEGKIALSSSYLLDFLSHIAAPDVMMEMSDAMHPAVFTVSSHPEFLHLIMPLRMQEE